MDGEEKGGGLPRLGQPGGKASDANKKSIIFNACKREQFHPGSGYKKLFRRLRASYKVSANKDDLSPDRLDEANIVVFGGPREKFTEHEIEELKSFVTKGGSLVFLVGEGGDAAAGSNVNSVVEEYGMAVQADAVVRTVYYKYLYPKEVFVANGVLQPSIAATKNLGNAKAASKAERNLAAGGGGGRRGGASAAAAAAESTNGGLSFVYPYGATVTVNRPSTAILSSGPISYPLNRPVAAVFECPDAPSFPGASAAAAEAARDAAHGRVMVVGSGQLFGDEWLDKEENGKLADVLFRWLAHEKDSANLTEDRKDSDLAEYTRIPNTKALAERLRSCLQEHDPLPKDFRKLFNDTLFKFDTDLIPEAVGLFGTLGVKHEPLSLIPPQFEAPLPPLNPAVFPPMLRELPPPALDQFDLDEHFASSKQRLAQLTNKCTARDDLDFFVESSGEILGVVGRLPELPDQPKGGKSAKHILHFIMSELVKFKSINQEGSGLGGGQMMGSDGSAGGGGGQMMDFASTNGGMSLAGEGSLEGQRTPMGQSPMGQQGAAGVGGSNRTDFGESKDESKFAHK